VFIRNPMTGFCQPSRTDNIRFWPDMVLQKIIRPAALRAGITKRIGWHTFRHSYSSLLVANGENVKVVQELMRHASNRVTLEIYSHARIAAKRHAQERVVQMNSRRRSRRCSAHDSLWRTTSGNPVVELGMNG